MTSTQIDDLSPHERRKSYRCTINGKRRDARLRVGMREIAAEIVDESTDGFSVLASPEVDCSVGQTLLLKTSSGWVEVRVMSVLAADHSGANGERRSRLGVLRLRDVDASEVEDEAVEPLTWSDMQELMRATFTFLRPVARAGGLIVLAPVVGIVLYFALEHSAPVLEAMRDDSALFVLEGSMGHSRLPPAHAQPVTPEPPEAPPAPVASAEPVEVKPQSAVMLLRPERLLDPDVSRRLELSAEQSRQLREVFDEFQAAAASAGSSAESINEWRRRALEILTDAQRALLAKLPESEGELPTSVQQDENAVPAEGN